MRLFDFNRDGKFDKEDLMRYEWIVITGMLLTIIPLLNVFGITEINSDLFWTLAGVCLTVEGVIELYYEQKHWDEIKKQKEIIKHEEERWNKKH